MIDRRTMLFSSASLLVAVSMPGAAATDAGAPRHWPLWSALDHPGELVALGRKYERLLPDFGTRSAAALASELGARLHLAMESDAASVAAALRRSMAADFRREDVRAVDGWMLSATEILLATVAFRAFASDEAEAETR